jgi:hypothetical protein
MRLAFYLVYIFGGSTPVYGRRNEVIGRTQHIPFFRGQALRLPDDAKKRVEAIDAIRLSSDQVTMPVQHAVLEAKDGSLHEFDPSEYMLVKKDGGGTQTQEPQRIPVALQARTYGQTSESATFAPRAAVVIKPKAPKKPKPKQKKATKKKASQPKARDIEGDIKCLIEANGPLTADQMADFLAEPKETIFAYTKDPDKFIRDGDFYTINPANK